MLHKVNAGEIFNNRIDPARYMGDRVELLENGNDAVYEALRKPLTDPAPKVAPIGQEFVPLLIKDLNGSRHRCYPRQYPAEGRGHDDDSQIDEGGGKRCDSGHHRPGNPGRHGAADNVEGSEPFG